MNIFTTQAFLNRELAAAFELARFGDVMEMPLDSNTAKQLRLESGDKKLPRWMGVGGLTPDASEIYQACASQVAHRKGVPRACLDIFLWRPVVE